MREHGRIWLLTRQPRSATRIRSATFELSWRRTTVNSDGAGTRSTFTTDHLEHPAIATVDGDAHPHSRTVFAADLIVEVVSVYRPDFCHALLVGYLPCFASVNKLAH